MKRSWASITVLCLFLGALASPGHADTRALDDLSGPASRREILEQRAAMPAPTGAVLVSFKGDATRREKVAAIAGADGEVVDALPALDVKVVEVEPGSEGEVVESLLEDPAVKIAEPDVTRSALDIPDDPLFDSQWGLHNGGQKHPITDPMGSFKTTAGKNDADIDAPQAWDIQTGSLTAAAPVIAILDQGFDVTHPDIATNRWTHPGEIPNNDVDDDGNGYVDDLRGWDFTDGGDPDPMDPGDTPDKGHGTHVAAIAAGVGNNGTGVAGVCRGCKILPLRFGLTLGQELEAIEYIIRTIDANPDANIKVLNASFGSWTWSALERKAFQDLGKKGVLTVAAAGNGGLDNDMFDAADFEGDGIPDDFSPLYPASYELSKILSVAATNDKDQLGYFTGCDRRAQRYRCFFSNYGRASVDVGAPGTDITSAYLTKNGNPRYRTWNGTSMAAPSAAGVAGLVSAEHPRYGARALKNAVMNSVDKPGSLKKVWRTGGRADKGSFLRTNGRVNALSALTGRTDEATVVNDGMIAGARGIKGRRRGSVSWPGDVNDVYKKRLKRGVSYVANLKSSRRRRNIDLLVHKPGTKDVWQLEDGCFGGGGRCSAVQPFRGFSSDGVERIAFTARQTGKYFFLVSSYYVRSGYRLKVRRTD